MKDLQYDLYTKKPLRFHSDGTFRILMLSDIQEAVCHDGRTLRAMEGMLEAEQPDLVLLGGDNCYAPGMPSGSELREYLQIFSSPMERRGIPWAHVFGNHDHDLQMPTREQQEIYEAFPNCVSKHTDEGIHGVSNCVLPILHSGSDTPAFHVWMLDSNNVAEDYFRETGRLDCLTEFPMPERPDEQGPWDKIRFDQIMWYYTTSAALEQRFGHRIPGMLVTHKALWEFHMVVDNPMESRLRGSTLERLDLEVLNSGLFSALVERGDVCCVAAGHTHMDDFQGEYMGIRLCLDGCAGWNAYGVDSLRGGRVFDLREDAPGKIETRMTRSAQYVK